MKYNFILKLMYCIVYIQHNNNNHEITLRGTMQERDHV